MLSVINILTLFFVMLLFCQILFQHNTIEGLENKNKYDPYDTTRSEDALILAQKNAGNISYLKERIDGLDSIQKTVQDLSGNMVTLQNQVNGLLQAQQDYASQMVGDSPPDITGAVDDDE